MRPRRGRRIDRHHDRGRAPAPSRRARSISAARQQRVGPVLDDLGVELLAAEPRAAIAADDRARGKPARDWRALAAVAARRHRASADRPAALFISGIGRGVVVTTCRGASPSRKPNCSMSQAFVGVAPFGQLVAPGGAELRAAQALRIFGREHCATAPFGQVTCRARRLVERPRDPADAPPAGPTRPRPSRCARRASVSPTSAMRAGAAASVIGDWRAPIRPRRASCRRRARRASARWSRRRRLARPRAATDRRAPTARNRNAAF